MTQEPNTAEDLKRKITRTAWHGVWVLAFIAAAIYASAYFVRLNVWWGAATHEVLVIAQWIGWAFFATCVIAGLGWCYDLGKKLPKEP